MGIFDRVSKLIKANANSAVDKLSDPAKEIDQLILDMEAEVKRARGETAQSMAQERLLRTRLGDLEKKVADWGRRAEDAVRAGDDELAKEALARQTQTDEELKGARRELDEAARLAASQQELIRKLDVRLREIKAKKGTIKAKVNYGKNAELSHDAADEFDRMAGRVDDNEAEGDAAAEVEAAIGGNTAAKDADVSARLDKLKGGDLDDRLAALKKKLEK